jgi:hypothetical protein
MPASNCGRSLTIFTQRSRASRAVHALSGWVKQIARLGVQDWNLNWIAVHDRRAGKRSLLPPGLSERVRPPGIVPRRASSMAGRSREIRNYRTTTPGATAAIRRLPARGGCRGHLSTAVTEASTAARACCNPGRWTIAVPLPALSVPPAKPVVPRHERGP